MNEKSHEKWKIEESQPKKKLKEKIPIWGRKRHSNLSDWLSDTHTHTNTKMKKDTRKPDQGIMKVKVGAAAGGWCPLSGRIMWREEIFFWFGFWGVFKKTKSKNNDTATTVKTSSPPMAKAKQSKQPTKQNLKQTYISPCTHTRSPLTHSNTHIHSGTRPHMYKHALPNKCNENSKCE